MSLDPALAKEFSLADDLGGTAQEDPVARPPNHLRAAGSVDIDWRIRAARSDRGHRRSARTSAGGLGFTDTTLIESDFDIVLALDPHKLHVDPVLEVVMPPDLRAFRLPGRRKILYEDHEVRIPHGDRRAVRLAESQLDGEIVAHLRLAHVHLELKGVFVPRQKFAMFDSRAGADSQLAGLALANQAGGNAARAVTGDLGFAAIGVDQAGTNVGFARGKQPFHAVCADAIVTIAHALAELVEILGCVHAFNDQKVVAAGRRLDEWHGHLVEFQTRLGLKVAQVVGLPQAILQFFVLVECRAHTEDNPLLAIEFAHAHAAQGLVLFFKSFVDLADNQVRRFLADDDVVHRHRLQVEPSLDPAQNPQGQVKQQSRKDGGQVETAPHGHADGGHHEDRGRRSESGDTAFFMEDRSRADEADAGDDLGSDARAIADAPLGGQVEGENRKHGGAKTDEHVGPQARGPAFQLPLQAYHPAQD